MKQHLAHCPDCGAPTSVADEAYCANRDCLWNNKPSTSTPPVENSNSEGGPKGTDGRGVCTPVARSNLDQTRLGRVRKGVTVSDRFGVRIYVARVRLGAWQGHTLVQRISQCGYCADVKVVV